MAVFPSDDLALSAATRGRLRPLIGGYKSYFLENVKRNDPISRGKTQARDMWLGRKKWVGECPFDLRIDDVELLMSFYEIYGVSGFTAFDFEQKQVGSPGYRPAVQIGTADGTAGQFFTLPAKDVVQSSVIIYVSDVSIGAGFTFSSGTGAQGEDRVQITAGQTNGAKVTAAFKGRCRYTCEIPRPPEKANVDWNRQTVFMILQEKF
jgi:hypothetical protein